MGYNKLSNVEKPKLDRKIEKKHIKKAIKVYIFLFISLKLFRNPYPLEMAVVNIAPRIIKPHIYL